MANQFIVIAYAANLPENTDCEVVAEDAVYKATHTKVFGPASKDECEDWVRNNCKPRVEDKE